MIKHTLYIVILAFFLDLASSTASDKIIHTSYSNNRNKEGDLIEFIDIGYQIIDTDASKTLSTFAIFEFSNLISPGEMDNMLTCYTGVQVPFVSDILPFSNIYTSISIDIGAGLSLGNFFGSEKINSIAGMLAVNYIFNNKFGFRVVAKTLPDFNLSGNQSLVTIGLFLKI